MNIGKLYANIPLIIYLKYLYITALLGLAQSLQPADT